MKYIIKEINNNLCKITINRPEQLNALNILVINDLRSCFESILDDAKVKAVIITGSGEKAFIAGADIKEMAKLTIKEAEAYALNGQSLTQLIEYFPKPVIAAVNGYALGGGCELAMACHIRYASNNAQFGQPEVGLGIIAGFGGTQRLPRLVGKGLAFELLLSGKMITAQSAKEIGLVNAVFPMADLIPECEKLANKIINNAPLALEKTINAVNLGLDGSLADGLKQEAAKFGKIFSTSDISEGMNAFIEKRKPKFKGK